MYDDVNPETLMLPLLGMIIAFGSILGSGNWFQHRQPGRVSPVGDHPDPSVTFGDPGMP